MASTTANVEKPQAGQSVPVTLSEGQATVSCKAGDIESMQMTDGGKLLMTFKDGASITVNNFQEFAAKGSILTLADGTTVNTVELLSGVAMKPQAAAANDGAEILVGQPPAGQTAEIELAPGQKYNFAFDDAAKESVTQEAGALVITFQDGGKLVLKNFSDALDASDPVQVSVGGEEISLSEFAEIMKLADAMNDKLGSDQKPVMAELREEAGDVSKIEPAAGEQQAAPESQKTSMQDVRQDMAAMAEQLAGIEPAAGGQAGGGAGARGGFGFQSTPDAANVIPLAAIGPIGPTALQFGLPGPAEPYFIPEESEPVGPPSVVANLGLNDAFVKEDGSIFVPIVATIGANGDGDEVLTLTVTGIPSTWNPVFAGNATYDPASGTWTITLPPGTNYTGGVTVTPPAESDVDLPGISATVTVFDPDTGGTQSATDTFNVIVDAVADLPHVDAPDNQGVRGTPLAVTITGGLGSDQDGSESITHYTVTGLPNGFTFNKGTYDPATGVWTFTPAEITGLLVTPPAGYHGAVPMVVTIYNQDTPTDREGDTSDNTNSASDPFTLTWTPKITPPDLTINNQVDFVNGQVKEDGSVTIPVKAVLAADAIPGEYLTVTITGIPSSWNPTFTSGTYNPATGTWTVTLPANTNFDGSFTVSPPADTDIDLSGLVGTAVATQPSSGLSASDTDGFGIVVDAVADKPHVDAPDNQGVRGTPLAVTITGGLGSDQDGSESITHYTVTGLPNGFTFNNGSYDPATGVWTFTPAQITGLTVTPPANYHGKVDLNVTVYNRDTPTDGEYDTTDNTNSASDPFTLTWTPKINPPDIKINNQVDFVNGQVKEDGSVTIPVKAVLAADAIPGEYLTVTITGIPSSWNPSFTSGTYNPVTSTWTVTLPANTNFDGSFTVSPPANSDIDLSGLVGTAVATQPSSGLSASDSDGFGIIVDAVADKPTISASAPTLEEGNNIPVTINAALTDRDGSEVISGYSIAGLPAGYSFNQGTYDSVTKVWNFTPAQIAGLQIVPPANGGGANFTLKVTVYNTENPVSDGEFDTTDNNNSATTDLAIKITPDTTPILIQPEKVTVDETNLAATGKTSISDRIEADFKADAPGTFAANGGFSSAVPLTSNGVAVVVTQVGGVYTGKAGADTIFTLTLQSNGEYKFDLTGTLDHPNKADHNDGIALQFGVRATDSDGDGVNGVITVNVLDDGVDARDDFAEVTTSIGHVDGNVLTNDYRGQDTPSTVTKVQFGSTSVDVPPTGTATIVGQYGTLKIAADGSYTYTLNGSTAGIGQSEKEFTTTNLYPAQSEGAALNPAGNFYGVTAGDLKVSDPTVGTITFRSEGAGYKNTIGMFTYGADGTITASDILVANGDNAPFGSTFSFNADAGQTIGFFLIADGFSTNPGVDLSTGSVALIYKYGTPDARAAAVTDAGADVVMVHTSTAGVKTVLNEPIYFSSERGGSHSLNEDGSVRVVSGLVDAGDNTVLRIGFEDLPNMGDKDFNDIVFDVTLTEDCGCADDKFTYTLTDSDGDTDTAVLTLECLDDDTTPVVVKPADKVVDESDFAAGAVSTSGQLQADFFADGPGTFGHTGVFTSSVPLTSNGVAVVVSLVSGVYVGKAGAATVFTLTTQADGQYQFNLLDTLDHPNKADHNDSIALNFGVKATDADGDAATTVLTINVKDDGVDARDDSVTAETATGSVNGNVLTNDYRGQDLPSKVTQVQFGNTTVSVPATGDVSITGQYGVLKINADGVYTYTQKSNHVSGQDKFTYTLTDADGDSDKAILSITNQDNDPIPSIVKPDAKTVDETSMGANPLTTSNPQTVGGQLQADFKADAPGTFGANGSFGSSVTGLKSNGVTVDVTYANGVYTGKAGNVTVFTLQVSPNGAYSFTLREPLDHPNTNDHNDNIALTFGATATDSDGDTVATTITINVKDDGVDAVNDVASFDGGLIGFTTAGNVLTNDDFSQDVSNTVSAIRLGTNGPLVQLNGSEQTIVGQFGTLKIKPDGSYTYTTTKLNGTQDSFTYTLKDGDGDTDTATLTLKGIAPTLIVGENVDDVPGSDTPWEVGGGKGKIEGGAASDILIGDVGGSALEEQGKDYNIVLMLDVSGSMGSKDDPNSRISLLVKAVKNLVGEFNGYEGGDIRVNIIGFASGFAGSFIFTATDDADYAEAIQHLNSLTGNGFTNYEAALQDALAWHNGTSHYAGDATEYRPIAGAENISYFISDGQPNRYVTNNSGSAGSGDSEAAWNAAMNHINGVSDGTNEIAMLQNISNVIAVGINIDSSRLDTIDSDGDALNVRDARDLDAVLADSSPLTRLSGVGDDILTGGDGSDLIFGDSVNTDVLATAMGLNTNAGSGWDVFARLEMGQSAVKPGWTRADTLEYIRTHAEELGKESLGSGGVGRTGGDDELRGGAGNDTIFGQEGDDQIWGGAGDDVLYGGSGADRFGFEGSPALNGVDTIKFSFADGDALDLSAMLTAYNATQDAIDQFVFATTVNGNTVVSVDVTGSGNIANAQAVAILQGVTGVTNVEDLLTSNSGGNVA